MKKHNIAVIAGDGIGPEVISEGVKVLSAVSAIDGTFEFEITHFPWGCEYYLREGRMMPENSLNTLSEFDAIFLGAVHGSAPDIAGKRLANPLVTVWSASQMLDFFGQETWGARLLKVIEQMPVDGDTLTPDLGGTATTSQVGDRVVEILNHKYKI